jgi:rhamnose utilization protein RhaD (predicted bifunctional aldolase and dehydrogenase)/NAD(P)-dependent dehydrogenase (short-subunit alcohol dehydrogenase family)
VEAILHAIIPFKFVDHTHADAVVALTNTTDGEARVREVFGERALVVPYVMPGFTLARHVYERTRGMTRKDWERHDGMVLLHHGVFTWGDDARTAYERMIAMTTKAMSYLERKGALSAVASASVEPPPALELALLRQQVSRLAGKPMLARLDCGPEAAGFARREDCVAIGTRGPLTPDHVIRTKLVPVALDGDRAAALAAYGSAYRSYFEEHDDGSLTMLDPAPRWAIWRGVGTVAFGESMKAAQVAGEIVEHTLQAIQWAEALGGWQALPRRELFEVEYWELEQAKLRKGGSRKSLQGKVALVTGAASGIGRACARALHAAGAAVVGLDLVPAIEGELAGPEGLGLVCDVTDTGALSRAVDAAVLRFGGLDLLIANAGVFPQSDRLQEMDETSWARALEVNLTAQQRLLKLAIPYLERGIEPAIVAIGSKNVAAPGPGAGAYSVSKAGLNQLMRLAALELAPAGIRVNVVHPDAVFDTGLWSADVIARRAQSYGLSVEDYKRRNLLRTSITSDDVAAVVLALCTSAFGKTTGAQIPVDGGNERVI